ncbi:MAG: hypothetical protein Satyrvirus15_13 [Satyrvirus sp.]|uniref:Uncharacterized protein n=1 Tax=Satyrvirus sp. TaxID=2487771 RepID=A0A3G5ADW7_9VIRU|nr:MAG: hypothetical protein Satyrvirus15_13 [Satyrvirus sp.]
MQKLSILVHLLIIFLTCGIARSRVDISYEVISANFKFINNSIYVECDFNNRLSCGGNKTGGMLKCYSAILNVSKNFDGAILEANSLNETLPQSGILPNVQMTISPCPIRYDDKPMCGPLTNYLHCQGLWQCFEIIALLQNEYPGDIIFVSQ